MKIKIAMLWLAGIILGYSCAPIPTKTGKKAEIDEDLSVYRGKYDIPEKSVIIIPKESPETVSVEPSHDLTAEIDILLDTIARINRSINYIQGYTILIRGGQLEEAREIRQRVMSLFPETNPQLAFDRPVYKVKVGQFYSKIEANKLYSMIKEQFPNRVILAPERITID